MAVLRVNKTKDYTVMSNEHLRNKNLSLKAKGLLSVMLSLPEKWDYSVAGLVAISKENETAVKSTLAELRDEGYLIVTKLMPNETKSGRIEYVYDIYETPKQEGKKQGVENLGLEILGVENQGQLNTNKSITKQSNTKTKDIDLIVCQIEDEQLRQTVVEFVKMRKSIKKPLTAYGLELTLKNLNKLSANIDEQVSILEQSITNCWQGVFALKETKKELKQDKEVGFALLNDYIKGETR